MLLVDITLFLDIGLWLSYYHVNFLIILFFRFWLYFILTCERSDLRKCWSSIRFVLTMLLCLRYLESASPSPTFGRATLSLQLIQNLSDCRQANWSRSCYQNYRGQFKWVQRSLGQSYPFIHQRSDKRTAPYLPFTGIIALLSTRPQGHHATGETNGITANPLRL